MNLFMRSIGFKGYGSKDEDTLIRRAISAGIKSDKLLKNNRHDRAMIVYGVSPSAGIAVYGHTDGDRFVYDTHFPYLFTNRTTKEKEIIVFKNLTGESFCGITETGKHEVPRMFYISNPVDVLFEIDHRSTGTEQQYDTEGDGALRQIVLSDANVSYSGLAIAASVLLPAYNKEKFFKSGEPADTGQSKDKSVKISEKPETGFRPSPAMSTVKRAETEDILSIVDTHIYPGGQVGEGYVVLGNITGMREEENVISGQRFYIMTLQVNDETIDVAVNTADVIGEPRVGRRFNARMWLHGYVM